MGKDVFDGSIFLFSNQNLLILTTILFGLFVVSEIVGGIIANSLSLFGDAIAMSVDVLTYCGNIYAECLKNKNGNTLPLHHTIIITDVLIPILSLFSLLGVSAWVSYDASLRLRGHKQEDVEISFLFIFPIANFVVDLFCAFLFYIRRQDIFHHHHHRSVLKQTTSDYDFSANVSESSSDSSGHEIELSDMHSSNATTSRLERTNLVKPSSKSTKNQSDTEGQEQEHEDLAPHHGTNVNMMSAFTHISGDTLRTLATFAAAAVSSLFHIDPSICDAWAAIVVSATIVISALPLVYSISRAINATMYTSLAAAVVEEEGLKQTQHQQIMLNRRTESEEDVLERTAEEDEIESESGRERGGETETRDNNMRI